MVSYYKLKNNIKTLSENNNIDPFNQWIELGYKLIIQDNKKTYCGCGKKNIKNVWFFCNKYNNKIITAGSECRRKLRDDLNITKKIKHKNFPYNLTPSEYSNMTPEELSNYASNLLSRVRFIQDVILPKWKEYVSEKKKIRELCRSLFKKFKQRKELKQQKIKNLIPKCVKHFYYPIYLQRKYFKIWRKIVELKKQIHNSNKEYEILQNKIEVYNKYN